MNSSSDGSDSSSSVNTILEEMFSEANAEETFDMIYSNADLPYIDVQNPYSEAFYELDSA